MGAKNGRQANATAAFCAAVARISGFERKASTASRDRRGPRPFLASSWIVRQNDRLETQLAERLEHGDIAPRFHLGDLMKEARCLLVDLDRLVAQGGDLGGVTRRKLRARQRAVNRRELRVEIKAHAGGGRPWRKRARGKCDGGDGDDRQGMCAHEKVSGY